MKILLDTNMFIASEHITATDADAHADAAVALLELVAQGDHEVFVSKTMTTDLLRDRNAGRSHARFQQLRKYKALAAIPYDEAELAYRAGYTTPLSDNDSVDLSMLAALEARAVSIVVTQDTRLRGHGAALGYAEQVLSAADAADLLRTLAKTPVHLPTLEERPAYTLNRNAPILASLRSDYHGFDAWFDKVCSEHRDCLFLEAPAGVVQGLVIFKRETDSPYGLGPDVLKVCTFKVAAEAVGAKRGELLLRGVFDYCRNNACPVIYVEVLAKYGDLVALFEDFGFEVHGTRSAKGELVMVKHMQPPAAGSQLAPLEYHRRYGPGAAKLERVFIVPVEPRWHDILFPELAPQPDMFGPQASGNALRKAYLCRANTTKMQVGDAVLFYKSGFSEVTCLGVVDRVERLTTPESVAEVVGRRTVYDLAGIERMCDAANDGVLTILFRWDRWVTPRWSLGELLDEGVLAAAPQSITEIKHEGALKWVQSRLAA